MVEVDPQCQCGCVKNDEKEWEFEKVEVACEHGFLIFDKEDTA
jgi:hypothetical protein